MPKPIHVGFLINQKPPIGGIQNFVINLINRIDKIQFRCTLINYIYSEPLIQKIPPEHGRVVCLNKKPGLDVAFIKTLYDVLKQVKPDIIQTHNWGTLIEGRFAGALAGSKRFIHAERGTLNTNFSNIAIQHLVWRYMSKVLCVSEAHKNEIIQSLRFPGSKIFPIRNGVDIEKFKPDPHARENFRREMGLQRNHLCIGTVGYLRPVKNQILLIRACSAICKKYPFVRVCLIGDGAEKENLKTACLEFGIERQVLFCGARNDIPSVLNGFDLFVLPSLNEGMPNAVLEAMATGLPVLASNVGGTPEVVEDQQTGMLFPNDHKEILEKHLETLICDSEKRKIFGQNGLHRVAQLFSLNKMVQEYENLYKEIVV